MIVNFSYVVLFLNVFSIPKPLKNKVGFDLVPFTDKLLKAKRNCHSPFCPLVVWLPYVEAPCCQNVWDKWMVRVLGENFLRKQESLLLV